jgi:hypothetical protein
MSPDNDAQPRPLRRRTAPDFPVMSVIGMNWFVPITLLLDELGRHAPTPPNDFQATPVENGLSAALALVSATLLESYMRRVQVEDRAQDFWTPVEDYFADMEERSRAQERARLRRYRARLTTRRLSPFVREVFMLRDAIAHNHIWHGRLGWSEDGELLVSRPRTITCSRFVSLKTLAILARGSQSAPPAQRLSRRPIGRFSGVDHWPVLGVHRGPALPNSPPSVMMSTF